MFSIESGTFSFQPLGYCQLCKQEIKVTAKVAVLELL